MDSPVSYQLPLFPPEKCCTKCGICRPLSEYTPDKRAADGLQKWCKPCRAAYYVAYRDGHRLRPDIPEGQKYCRYCQTLLPLDAFGFNRARGDGRQSYCRACRPRRYQEREKKPVEPRPRGKRLALIPAEKRCPTCGVTKPEAAFYRSPTRPDGLASVCRSCARADMRQRVRANKERYAAAKKAYLAAHPTFNRDYLRRWYAANPEKMREYRRRQLEAHPERIREQAKKSRLKRKGTLVDKLLRARSKHARRSREAASERTLTAQQWQAHLDAIGWRCLCCGQPFSEDVPATIDHIVPLSKGGGLTIDNVQGLCGRCNLLKGTRSTDYRPADLR